MQSIKIIDVLAVVEGQALKWSRAKGFNNLHTSLGRKGFRASYKAYHRKLKEWFPALREKEIQGIISQTKARAEELRK